MKTILNGILDVFKNKKLIFKLYSFYLCSYLLFFIVYKSFLKTLDSLEGIGAERLENFNFTYLLIMIRDIKPLLNIFTSLILVLLLGYFIYSQIILKRFTENLSEKAHKVKHFWKILFSWLYIIPPAAFCFVSIVFLYKRSQDLITINPNSAFIMEIICIILLAVLGIFVLSLLDTTRIVSISSKMNSFLANLYSYKIVFKNYLKFLFLYLFYGIFFLLFLFLYNQLMNFTTGIRWNNILFLLFFHLLFFIVHLVMKFAVFSIEFQIIKNTVPAENMVKNNQKNEEIETVDEAPAELTEA